MSHNELNLVEHNRAAWNAEVASGTNPWSQPVDDATIERARRGEWSVVLTPTRAVPRHWFGQIRGADLLGLASGGGQQVPIFAAAGAKVTSFDNSDAQLALDEQVAARHQLPLRCVQGDMADLSCLEDQSFDLIFHPVSNVFAEDVLPVWRECYRVLKPGGRLLAGFMNPDYYLFDHEAIAEGAPLQVRYALPYADPRDYPAERLAKRIADGDTLEFSHSLDTQIGGQLAAGFLLAGFYEDRWNDEATVLNRYMPTSMATLALKSG